MIAIITTITLAMFLMLFITMLFPMKTHYTKINLMTLFLMSLIPLNFLMHKEQETKTPYNGTCLSCSDHVCSFHLW